MAYLAQPGTIPHRVIEWFKQQEAGTELAAVVICETLGIENTNSFASWMAPARKAGLLKARTKPTTGRTLFWSLGSGEPEAPPVDFEPDEPLHPAGGEEAQAEEFMCRVYDDGDVDLYGLLELEDGGRRLTPDMVAKLKRLITWMPA